MKNFQFKPKYNEYPNLNAHAQTYVTYFRYNEDISFLLSDNLKNAKEMK